MRRLRVGLLIETSNAYCRRLLAGIRQFSQEQGGWSFQLSELGRGEIAPEWLERWKGDGVIARVETPERERVLRRLEVPVVNVSASGFGRCFPTIISDSASIAQLAAEHLLECGFREFAFCGDHRLAWALAHEENFVNYLSRRGRRCHVFHPAETAVHTSRADLFDQLVAWVRQLPKPIGIMAHYDFRGAELIAACHEAGVSVPHDVAVISQQNDPNICEFCDPPLSSVMTNPYRVGYLAASMLYRMVRGERVPAVLHTVPAIRVVARGSTDVIQVPDENLAAAIRLLRDRATTGIRVRDILKIVPISRTMLERKFKKHLGISPRAFLMRVRLREASRLLSETNLSIEQVARQVGFGSAAYLSGRFRRLFGISPRRYRQEYRVFSDDEFLTTS